MSPRTRLTLLLLPPLAFARLGNSDTPLEAYYWGPNDDTPSGTGKTTIVPAPTLTVDERGFVTCHTPASVTFKDAVGFRPVCPFFELWARRDGETEIPLTPERLSELGLEESQLVWTVRVANLKPYFMTGDPDTAIRAEIVLRGGDPTQRALEGKCDHGAAVPLVPHGRHIPLGCVRLTRPNAGHPEFRLRFTPGNGRFYGPPDVRDKWKGVQLPSDDLFLNPESSWCKWTRTAADPRGWPPGQYAQDGDSVSYGLVDDVCDGIVSCAVADAERHRHLEIVPASARIVVGPPDYAPDRRPIVSLADGLKDRVERHLPDNYFARPNAVGQEVGDLFERVFETLGLINLDVFNDRVDVQENALIALERGIPYHPPAKPAPGVTTRAQADHRAFEPPTATRAMPLPLTERARQYHRRFIVGDVLAELLRKRPDLLREVLREPLSDSPFFDQKMPALMKDASGGPLHLTRRQYHILLCWAAGLAGAKGDAR